VSPRAAAAFFESLVLIFIERLRASGDLVAEVTAGVWKRPGSTSRPDNNMRDGKRSLRPQHG